MAILAVLAAAIGLVALVGWFFAQITVVTYVAVAIAFAKEIAGYGNLWLRFGLYAACLAWLYASFDRGTYVLVWILVIADGLLTLMRTSITSRAIVVALITLAIPIKDVAFAHAAYELEAPVIEQLEISSFGGEPMELSRSRRPAPYVVRSIFSVLVASCLIAVGLSNVEDDTIDLEAVTSGFVVAILFGVIALGFVKNGYCEGSMSSCLQDLGFDRSWWPAIHTEIRVESVN